MFRCNGYTAVNELDLEQYPGFDYQSRHIKGFQIVPEFLSL